MNNPLKGLTAKMQVAIRIQKNRWPQKSEEPQSHNKTMKKSSLVLFVPFCGDGFGFAFALAVSP
ncbi:MAG: hypothetical protein PHX38_04985 [Sulfuricella sp.]|nr:hypothetical protein [Sulfuricella sp.]